MRVDSTKFSDTLNQWQIALGLVPLAPSVQVIPDSGLGAVASALRESNRSSGVDLARA